MSRSHSHSGGSSSSQPLTDALEEHYQTLIAETKKVQLNSSSSHPSSISPRTLSPRSTASTASSDLSPSLSPSSSKRDALASLDDDDSSSSSSSSSSSTSFRPPSLLSSRSSRLPLPQPTARVDSLVHLCTLSLSHQLDHMTSLRHLPEEVVQQLLYLTLMRSALTPSLCKLFATCGHDSVEDWIAENIDTSAVLLTTTQSCRERF